MTEKSELKGLGGWLVVIGIGVILNPIRLLATAIPIFKPIFEDGTWEAISTTSSAAFNPYLCSLIVGEISFNSIMLAASIYLIYLFFSEHYLFPKIYIGIIAASLIFILLDAWIVTKLLPSETMFDPDTKKELMRSLISGGILVPYMLISKRVQLTFVKHIPNKQMQPSAESVG